MASITETKVIDEKLREQLTADQVRGCLVELCCPAFVELRFVSLVRLAVGALATSVIQRLIQPRILRNTALLAPNGLQLSKRV